MTFETWWENFLDGLIRRNQERNAMRRGEKVCPGDPMGHEALEGPCPSCKAVV